MTYVADVNVLMALTTVGHVHHRAAMEWVERIEPEIAVCRVSQMGLLRLLTNATVMGNNALSAAGAWSVFGKLMEDTRLFFSPEPEELDAKWQAFTRHSRAGANFWTDAYLAAFAEASGYGVVTFDARFSRYSHLKVARPA